MHPTRSYVRVSESRRQVLWAFGFAGLGVLRREEIDPLLLREGSSRNGWQPTADARLTMELRTQPVANHGNGFGRFYVVKAGVVISRRWR